MKLIFLSLIIALLSFNKPSSNIDLGTLKLKIVGINKVKGNIGYVIFNQEEGFPEDENKALLQGEIEVSSTDLIIEIPNLPYGKYAVALMHDINSNKEMDKNFVGLPLEPFGFTNITKIPFGTPKFTEAAIDVNQIEVNTTVDLLKIF